MDRGSRPRILVCDPLDDGALDLLRQAARVDVQTSLAPDELVAIIDGYDALVIHNSTTITSEVIEAGSTLRAIARAGVSYDNIDVDAATQNGVYVINAPGAATNAVAELTIGLILALLRQMPAANRSLKAGHWHRQKLRGQQLSSQTLGVIGYGRIGREVARLARAFGAKVLAHTRTLRPMEHAERIAFDRLLAESDIISLHAPLTDATRHLINRETIQQMRTGAYIINTSAGGLIDEAALLEALESGKIAGAGLDVFANEPPGDSPLLRHPHVICTPRLGAHTAEVRRTAAMIAVQGLLAVLRGEPSEYVVNPLAG